MSLKHNIVANYVSQFYVTLIGIVMVPMYVRYMGIEAYGLIGFFTMLQVWFQLLDVGLRPTLTRETARFRGGAISAVLLWRLLRTLELIFVGIAVLGAAAMIAGADAIARNWLQVQKLPIDEVRLSIVLMALIIALRWISGLYRSAVAGFEHQVWLSTFNSVVATVRFLLVIPFFIFVGTRPVEFFGFQLAVALGEAAMLAIKTYRLLPAIDKGERITGQWQALRGVLKFSLTLAFTHFVWILVTQTDKLILSRLLPLADYAYFTLAVVVANGVTLIAGPISSALQPRLAKLSAQGDEEALIHLYRSATQLVGVIAFPAALMLAFFSEQVLWAWTGDVEIVRRAAPVLTLYALGNGVLAFGAFPYYLQFAKGDLRMHLIGNLIFVLVLVPASIWATVNFGMIGAGYAWLCTNCLLFVLWIPRVHDRLVKGLHVQWVMRDVGGILLLALAGGAAMHWLVKWPDERISVAVWIAILSLALLAIAAAGSSWIRDTIGRRVSFWRAA